MATVDKFSDRAIRALREPGFYCDGRGLYIQVSPSGAKSWVYKFMLRGRARAMGLGSFHDISLAEARAARDEARRLVKEHIDPIEARIQRREENVAEQARIRAERAAAITFKQAAEQALPLLTSKSGNAKHIAQWSSSLAEYAYPVLGDLDIRQITSQDIVRCLEPAWKTRSETASRVRGRIEKVLSWAAAKGLRSGDNPASWKAVGILLGAKAKGKNHDALPYAELPAFMTQLRAIDSPAARALEFTILTAARRREVIEATPSEIDADARIWRVHASHMKRRREHLVPLSKRALKLLSHANKKLLFPSIGSDSGQINDSTMLALLKRLRPDITVHGFRSTFRDWCAEQTSFEGYVAEAALAHELGDKTEAAYHRTTYLEKRRRLMDAWADYCAGTKATHDNVTQLRV